MKTSGKYMFSINKFLQSKKVIPHEHKTEPEKYEM